MKLCVHCKHFDMTASTPDYSTLTGGTSETIECRRGHWWMSNSEGGPKVFRENIEKAEKCKDFEHVAS